MSLVDLMRVILYIAPSLAVKLLRLTIRGMKKPITETITREFFAFSNYRVGQETRRAFLGAREKAGDDRSYGAVY